MALKEIEKFWFEADDFLEIFSLYIIRVYERKIDRARRILSGQIKMKDKRRKIRR